MIFWYTMLVDCIRELLTGTNGLMRTEHAETAVADTEDGWRRALQRLPQPPFRVAELLMNQLCSGYSITEINLSEYDKLRSLEGD